MAAPKPTAVVLLSGGLDSATAAAIVQAEGYDVVAVSFDYGQRHRTELARARQVAKALGARRHHILKVPLGQLGGSSLTDKAMPVPRAGHAIGTAIPSTYVPARNTVFLSLALAVAEVERAQAIAIGANALDYSGYPDCRPEYLEAFQRLAALATKAGVEGHGPVVLAPLLRMTKADIVRAALRTHAPIHLTWSCYRGGRAPCGACESCVLRAKGFAEAGVADPAQPAPRPHGRRDVHAAPGHTTARRAPAPRKPSPRAAVRRPASRAPARRTPARGATARRSPARGAATSRRA